MKYIKSLLKISVVLLFLILCVGSIYAADNTNASLTYSPDFNNNLVNLEDLDDWDDDLDDLDDEDDDFDDENDNLDDLDDEDDGLDDEDDEDDEFDDELDDGLDDEDDEDDEFDDELDDDWDYEDDDSDLDYEIKDFDYLTLEIEYYLMYYANNSDMDWMNTIEFSTEHKNYLINPDNYVFYKTEGYETYLKIYDSIISKFNNYNLTENEKNDLKFMIIYYLNQYGNVGENYTWTRFDEFEYVMTDFDYLYGDICYYLMNYGNNSNEDWAYTVDFSNEYQKYLDDSDNYVFYKTEGYETYLKIYDSIISAFNNYNLTENEKNNLKFMIIFYLNQYGNVSENYLWNRFDEFNYVLTEFDYLILKMQYYFMKYGNNSDLKWIETDDFYNEYQIYLDNPSNYTFNESAEGYETYLKIFDSITSTFCDYNLTENQTDYLKFMIIYYLNHFGNVSANYTWNESDDFRNFTHFWAVTGKCTDILASAAMPDIDEFFATSSTFYEPFINPLLSDWNLYNSTSTENTTDIIIPQEGTSSQSNIWLILLSVLFMLLLIL